MANSEKNEHALTLGGKAFVFKFGTSACIALQERLKTEQFGVGRVREALARELLFGFTLTLGPAKTATRMVRADAIEAALVQNRVPTIDEITQGINEGRVLYTVALVWAGLRKFHPEITENDVNDLLDASDEQEVRALLKAFGFSVTPDPKDVKALEEGVAKAANPPRAQTTRKKRGAGAASTSTHDALV